MVPPNSSPARLNSHYELRQEFRDPAVSSAPMMRWWWFGPHVKQGRLREQLKTIRDAGYGGVEAAFVYPLSEKTDSFMSESFLQDVRFAAEQAKELDMRFDLTLGSGWSYGGPHIEDAYAARRLHWEQHEVSGEPRQVQLDCSWPGDVLLGAYIGAGSLQEMPDAFNQLASEDGTVDIPPGVGPRVMIIAWSRLTGQNVKRAAAGAEGPVLDHYSAEATDAHIEAVCSPMLDAIPSDLIYSVFCDSLEVYGANWSRALPVEFTKRRGYDPLPELWRLYTGSQFGADFRIHFHKTLSEMYEDNFVARLRGWAASRNVLFRIQSYGEPPASISSFRAADLPEGEGWGWKDITQSRWATSAAQIYDRKVVSSEIWTWVHSPSFRATPLDMKGELHEHALIGINHFIGHGWPYYEEDSTGLGWIFYAAGALDDRNPWWPVIRSFTAYAHRLGWAMRQGSRLSEVGIYAPYSDVYSLMGSGQPHDIDLWAATKKHIGPNVASTIRTAGYDFDLFDDDAVNMLEANRFPVILLPRVERLPKATLKWLQSAQAAGTAILTLDGRPGIGEPITDVRAALESRILPPLIISVSQGSGDDIGITRRNNGKVDIYFVANTGPRTTTFTVSMSSPRTLVERWDLESGEVVGSWDGRRMSEVSLEPYEAMLLVASDEGVAPRSEPLHGGAVVPIDGPWTVGYADENRVRAVTLPHRWEDDPGRVAYSGAATYFSAFDWFENVDGATLEVGSARPESLVGVEREGLRGKSFRTQVLLPVGVAASVRINGEYVGSLWHPPYRLWVSNLRNGKNTVEITVFNTGANALPKDTAVTASAELSRQYFGQRFRMQDLERAHDGVSSGLFVTPQIRVSGSAETGGPNVE